MGTLNEFIANFHNLKGFTVGERRKNLFLFLNSLKFSNSRNVSEIIALLIPKTHLEAIFRVEFLLFFKRSPELFDVLKGGSEHLASKVFKNPWFFHHPFDELSADVIVNDLLPSLSFLTRNRMLRMLAKYNKDEAKLDTVFDALLKRYGIQTAKLILPGCSSSKIEVVFTSFHIILPPDSLRLVFNKNIQVFKVYMENCFSNDKGERHSKVAKDMVLTEPDMYFDLSEYFHVKLGRRATRRLLTYNRNKLIINALSFTNVNLKTVYKCLCRNDRLLFLKNLFPCGANGIQSYKPEVVFSFLKYFPRSEQFQLFVDTFESTYNKSLCDDVSFVNDFLLESIENVDEREKWVELIVSKNNKRDDYLQYYRFDKSFGLMKEKILSSKNNNVKSSMTKKMILICKINNDLDNLMLVIDFLNKHCRHEMDWIKKDILYSLSSLNLFTLKEEHWQAILNLCRNFKFTYEHYDTGKQILFLKYIEYQWKKKQPFHETLIEFWKNDDIDSYDCSTTNNRPDELDKYLIDLVCKLSPEMLKEEDPHNMSMNMIVWIQKWNARHKKSKISVYDYPMLASLVIKYVKDSINRYDYRLKKIISLLICDHSCSEYRKAIIDLYLRQNNDEYVCADIGLWLLKNDPEVFSESPDYFIKFCHSHSQHRSIWEYVKKSSHWELYNKTLSYCIEQYSDALQLLRVMACLMCPEDFVNIVIKHIPVTEKIDIDDEDSLPEYSIGSSVAVAFKYTKCAVVLPTLLKFCMGDYLGKALESLYYLFYHSPENQLNALLHELSTRAVSVRKHVFFLTSQVGTVDSMLNLVKSAGEHERNISVKKHILNTILRYFRKNPSDQIYELLKTWVPTLDVADTESLESLVKLNVPSSYQSRFFVFVLDYLTNKAKETSEISDFLDMFLASLNTDMIKNLPVDFCNSFIEKHFLEDDTCFSQDSIDTFTIKYLLYSVDETQRKVDVVLNKLSVYKNTRQTNLNVKITIVKNINKFMNRLLFELNYMISDEVLICNIYNTWMKLFTIDDFFNIYAKLKIGLLKKESKNIAVYAAKINIFLEEINVTYGPSFVKYIASSVELWINCDGKCANTLYLLCNNLWLCNQTVINCMFILFLLPSKQPMDQDICDRYFSLLETLEKHPDTSVRILCNVFVKTIEFKG